VGSFKNLQNGYTQSVSQAGAFLGCLLFGALYFAYKGAWKHALISFCAAFCTLGISWLIYPFFAYRCVENSYLERGWKRLGVGKRSAHTASSQPSFSNLP
jgi:cell division protein FtsX